MKARATRMLEIKTVGKSGQISLGKAYAGKTLRLDRLKNGRIMLTQVAVVPENQLWTLRDPDRTHITRALAWAANTGPSETDLDSLLTRVGKMRRKSRARKR